MNASMATYEDHEFNYSATNRRSEKPNRPKASNQPRYSRRRGKTPAKFNGIHRRRTKQIRW